MELGTNFLSSCTRDAFTQHKQKPLCLSQDAHYLWLALCTCRKSIQKYFSVSRSRKPFIIIKHFSSACFRSSDELLEILLTLSPIFHTLYSSNEEECLWEWRKEKKYRGWKNLQVGKFSRSTKSFRVTFCFLCKVEKFCSVHSRILMAESFTTVFVFFEFSLKLKV